MSRRNPDATACALAAAILLACVGVMLGLSRAKPPKATEKQRTSAREVLDAPREVDGVPCTRFVELAPDGRLVSCILERERAFGPVTLPANTQFTLRPDGSVNDVHLGADASFDSHACLGRGPGAWMTGFHPNGRLRYCFLAADETIDGVPCRHGSVWGEITGGVIVEFHDNGRLASCRLAADATVAGARFGKGDRVSLDPEGRPTQR
ncbi:MAG: hypothetical protein AB1625_14500 [Acidobacteriota bacterium]